MYSVNRYQQSPRSGTFPQFWLLTLAMAARLFHAALAGIRREAAWPPTALLCILPLVHEVLSSDIVEHSCRVVLRMFKAYVARSPGRRQREQRLEDDRLRTLVGYMCGNNHDECSSARFSISGIMRHRAHWGRCPQMSMQARRDI